jgi:hypothetical protein
MCLAVIAERGWCGMPDREKVIRGLECLITNDVDCDGCPYINSGYCTKAIAKDALELLKEEDDGTEQHMP